MSREPEADPSSATLPLGELCEALPLPALFAAGPPDDLPETVVAVNQLFTGAFGYAARDLPTLTSLWEKIGPDPATAARGRERWRNEVATLRRGGPGAVAPLGVVLSSRTRGSLDMSIRTGICGRFALLLFEESTAGVQVSREAEDARHLLQEIVDASPSMIFVVDAAGRVRFVNRYGAEYYGTTPEALIEASTRQVHRVESEAEQFVSDDLEVIRSRKKLEKDELNTSPSGELHWFHTVKVPLLRADGTVEVLGIATDVSARKQAETAHRQSEEKLRLVVAASGMGLWERDLKSDEAVWDDTVRKIWGVTPETQPRDLAGLMATVHPEDRERVASTMRRAAETGEYPLLEYRILRPDGSVRRVASRAAITPSDDGGPQKLIGSVLDVTEERELEEHRRQAQKLQAIGQLSFGVAHNFNNMLMGIIPNIELALPDVPPAAAARLRIAEQAAIRASGLVGQLITFSGHRRGNPRLAEDARTLVQRTVAMCVGAFPRSIELTVDCGAEALWVNVEPTQFEQVVLNLLINARDAVLDGRVEAPKLSVTVDSVPGTEAPASLTLARDVEYVRLQVRDNGIGMDEATRNRVFEPFFTTKEPGRGTGLGLSTTVTIMREHGGALDCVSVPGEGSCFAAYLPRVESADPPTLPPAKPASGGGETILVVDDEKTVRDVVRLMLEQQGYATKAAESAEQALELLSHVEVLKEIALVILDVSMPGMSGRVALEKLRERAPGIPIAFFTGFALDATEGADGLIEKPITTEKLARAVRDTLDRYRARKSARD